MQQSREHEFRERVAITRLQPQLSSSMETRAISSTANYTEIILRVNDGFNFPKPEWNFRLTSVRIIPALCDNAPDLITSQLKSQEIASNAACYTTTSNDQQLALTAKREESSFIS